MTGKLCLHCGHDIRERWHQHYGVQKLEKGSEEIGVRMVGKVKLRKEALVMILGLFGRRRIYANHACENSCST